MKDLLKPVGLDEPETVRLPAILGLREAGALRDQLLAVRGRALDLDGCEVERLGGLGLQVLLSAQATWRQDGQRFRLVHSSASLKQGLDLFGARHLAATDHQE